MIGGDTISKFAWSNTMLNLFISQLPISLLCKYIFCAIQRKDNKQLLQLSPATRLMCYKLIKKQSFYMINQLFVGMNLHMSYFQPCTDLIETKIDTTHDNQVLWLSTQGTQVFIFEKFVLTTVIDFLLTTVTTVLKTYTQSLFT